MIWLSVKENDCGCTINRQTVILGPLVQSIVSLRSLLVVKMLTVLVSIISNSQVFLLKKCEKLFTFFQQKILMYMPYLMIKASLA